MSFFQSDVVRAEMAEISELQEEVYNNVFKFPSMSTADQQYHVEILERLLEKQRVMYARLSLSDDPDAQQMKEQITQSALMMGIPKGSDITTVFNDMSRAVSYMKEQIDKNQLN
tara:strand:- start:262 stop:603 length:342 start_codon:yes stop_codon:yes gene_type:complete